MASISGAVGVIDIGSTGAIVFLHDPSNQGPFPTGAFLWSTAAPASPEELVTRSMWLSLATKSLQQHFSISIFTDDATGVATSVMLSDSVVDVPRGAATNPALQRELVERFVAARAA